MNPYRALAQLKLQMYIYQRHLICLVAAYFLYPQYFVFRDYKKNYMDKYNQEKVLATKLGLISTRIN